MLPELLYEIYKYLHYKDYLVLKKLESQQLCYLIESFRDPLEAKYIYFGSLLTKDLTRGIEYIARTNPMYSTTYSRYHAITYPIIEYAVIYGDLDMVKLLLNDSRVDPTISNNMPIRWAAHNGHLEIVKLLLNDPRVDPSDALWNNALSLAAHSGHVEIIKLLLNDSRVDPSHFFNDAIHSAVTRGRLEAVKLLYQDERVQSTLSSGFKTQVLEMINP